MSRLRKYQTDVKNRIYSAWQDPAIRVVCGVLPTGAGKTRIMADIAHEYSGYGVTIAHRSELVMQISVALAQEGLRHDIVAPKSVVRGIVLAHMAEVGRSYYDPRATWKVASVDTILRRNLDEAWCRKVGLVQQDECFPAGTLVDGKPIEQYKVGDYVTAFDETSGQFVQRQVTRLFSNPMPAGMVCIKTAHHAIVSTSGHPFWTRRGWVEAGHLRTDDELYVLQQTNHDDRRSATLSVSQDWPNLLHSQMRLCASRLKAHLSERGGYSCLHPVRHALSSFWMEAGSIQEATSRLLQRCLRANKAVANIVCHRIAHQQTSCLETYEEKQSDARSEHSATGVSNPARHEPQASPARRQWQASLTMRTTAVRSTIIAWLRNATPCSHWLQNWQRRLSAHIQTRSGVTVQNDRGGSEWAKSFDIGAQSTRPKEGSVFTWERVESIEFQQRASDDEHSTLRVYNLEVDELHTYVANGIVVHNCHHVLADNKWGRAASLFPNARMLGVTATPLRADGRGLGRHADGIVDALVEGPDMRWLIDQGYLTDYRVLAPQPSDFSMAGVEISSATGDYNTDQMRKRVKSSTKIIGDVVKTYLEHARGKLGITFAVDVEHATQICAEFNRNGVPAAIVTAETPDGDRRSLMHKFKKRELLQLVNVDLFGEGVDVPAIEVVSMARPTMSYGLFVQQFGRALRLMLPSTLLGAWDVYTPEQRKQFIADSGKPHAIIIDHVGNIITHSGPPDWRKEAWTLDARTKRRAATDGIPLRACANETCLQPFERIYPACPYCGWEPPPPSERGKPEHVDGDIVLYTPELLAKLFGDKQRVDGPPLYPHGATDIVRASIRKNHAARQAAQSELRGAMQLVMPPNQDERVNNRRFFLTYGVDTLTAQGLGSTEASQLRQRILNKLGAE